MRRYVKTLLTAGALLLVAALIARAWPPAALLAALAVVAWGEDLLLWMYTRLRPAEPRRVAVGEESGFPAAFDPRNKLYHWLWLAEPTRSVLGMESEVVEHEMYHKLALRRGEWLTFIVFGPDKYIRFTSAAYDLARVREVERALSEYYVLTRMKAWVGTGRPVSKAAYLTSLWLVFYAGLAGPFALFALPLWLWRVWQFRRHYVEPVELTSFAYKITADALTASRHTLEMIAPADAAAFAAMEKWAVAFTDRAPAEVAKRFSKTYEGRDTAKRLINLTRWGEHVARMYAYNERPIALYAFGSAPVYSLSLTRDNLAAAEFWLLREEAKALTGDLCRFPMMYGGKLLGTSREVQLAVDKFGRPVAVPIDSLPAVHSVIIGPSGMGKSWTVATWLLKLAEAGVRVVVVDPHGDYLRWAAIAGAQVLKVPGEVPDDLAEVLRQSQWFRRLLAELGSTDGADPAKWLEQRAAEKGLSPRAVPASGRHVVFDITALSADSAAQMLWAAVLLIYLVSRYMREKSEKLQTVIVFDEARLLSKHGVRGGETLIAMIEDLVQGGRKFGFGVWFILQLETQLPHDLIRSAALQLILGGNEMFVKGAAQSLYLEQADVNFLLAARTPGEAALGGQPTAMGVLRMAPRNIKYHVYIPLDRRLKPQR
ncbi:MAG: DUF87 domain-containing protein [Fervidicoccaceae archaeon]